MGPRLGLVGCLGSSVASRTVEDPVAAALDVAAAGL